MKKLKITILKGFRVFSILKIIVEQLNEHLIELSDAIDNLFKYYEKLEDEIKKLQAINCKKKGKTK